MNERNVGITWQTGSDEAILYTDPASLRELAKSLLKAAQELEVKDQIQITDHVLHLCSDVRIDWIIKVNDEEELRQKIAEYH